LTTEAGLTRPDGRQFSLRANGSDVALITATIVDKNGLWCPDADQNLHFSVEGPGQYRGSYNFYVDPSKPATYHAPGDPELQAEGGLMKVAVRSGFRPGKVTVTASSSGLVSGRASFSTVRASTQRR
jgi:beta-galactosidase